MEFDHEGKDTGAEVGDGNKRRRIRLNYSSDGTITIE
jgi:hypothetical protein